MMNAADSLLHDDSLRRAVEQLFLEGARFSPVETADTLAAAPPATAADLFGQGSILAAIDTTSPALLPLASNPIFQCLVLALTAVYVLIIYQHMGNIAALFAHVSHNTGRAETRGGNSYSQFLNITGLTGLLAAGILCVKCIDNWVPDSILPYGAAAGISLIATAVLMALTAIQSSMLYLIGAVTLTQNFTDKLIHLKRTTLSLMTITMTPILLLYALCPAGTEQPWTYLIFGGVIAILLFFLTKTLRLFISKKISILHWFLYLCTIEIFPVSLLWLLAVK